MRKTIWLRILVIGLAAVATAACIGYVSVYRDIDLVDAAIRDNAAAIYRASRRHQDMNIQGPRSEPTPIHYAAALGSLNALRALIACGASLNQKDVVGMTALHHASASDQVAAANILIDAGADIHARDVDGATPLHRAVFGRKFASVRLLISRGANLEATDKGGRTPIFDAITTGDENLLTLLLTAGASPNAKDKAGHSVLEAADGNARLLSILKASMGVQSSRASQPSSRLR